MAPFSPHFAVAARLSNRYEILQPIGQPFGYQQVLAHDTHQHLPVVIKSLAIEEQTPTGDICCFEREIHLLESLAHPTIPKYIDSFTIDTAKGTANNSKGLVLVQSHHGGDTLAQNDSIIGLRYSEADIKEIAKQLLQGLIYLHGKGLVHRDIKPSNIAVAGQGNEISRVSWLNLGTVQYVQAQRADAIVGTYGYMPPEQVGGQATFASDLYSLGATLIYLATGNHLGKLPRNRLKNGLKVKFACPTTQLSASFQAWINWLIEPCVGDRPSSAKEALGALNHLPFAMFKRRLLRPTQAQMLPIPIRNSSQTPKEPFFTQIKSAKKPRSLELVIPPAGIKSAEFRRSVPPLIMGSVMLTIALYLFSLLNFSATTLATVSGIASLAAASLGLMGCIYSFRFLRSGFSLLTIALMRRIRIQLETDVLLIAYEYPLRSLDYIINTRRADIYNISALPSGSALRILTHHNRTQAPCDCYQLTCNDGALSPRDIRWLTSLLNDWRHPHGA